MPLTIERKNIWEAWTPDNKREPLFVTTNSIIKKDGSLVMGAGIAKQAKDAFPGLDYKLASRIEDPKYGSVYSQKFNIGAFQVKHHYRDPASIDLITNSSISLVGLILEHDWDRIHLNYPGIGLGQLTKEEVEPILLDILGTFPITIYII